MPPKSAPISRPTNATCGKMSATSTTTARTCAPIDVTSGTILATSTVISATAALTAKICATTVADTEQQHLFPQAAGIWPRCLLFLLVAQPLIDDSLERLAGQEAAQIFSKQPVVTLPKLIGDGGSMWSDKAVFQRPIGRICWQRLFGKNVECGAANLLLLQG